MASTRPLRATRQSSRTSSRGGGGGDDDAADAISTGSGARRVNSYGRVYGQQQQQAPPPQPPPPQQGRRGAAGGGAGGEEMSYIATGGGGGGGGGAGGKKVNIPGFLTKTFEIFSSGEYSDLCGWGSGGDTIIIKKVPEFSAAVLPRYFKHSNFQSFVRQLNMYDFHKTVQDPSHGEFRHQYFKRGRPDLLPLIKRKVSQPTGATAAATAAATPGAAAAGRAPPRAPQDMKPLPPPPTSPALTAAAAMMSMPGSASARALDVVDGVEVGGGGGSKPSKSWQKRTETRLQECEEEVKRLGTENQLLWTQLHAAQAGNKALRRAQLRLVGIVQDLLLSGKDGAAGAAAGTGAVEGGVAPALQRLRAELEGLAMSPASAAAMDGGAGAGVGGGLEPDVLSALPPSMALAAGAVSAGEGDGAGVGGGGAQLTRMMSLSDPSGAFGFWRNFSRTGSLGSIPSFGPGVVHSLQDPASAAAGTAGVGGGAGEGGGGGGTAVGPGATAAAVGGGGVMSPPSGPAVNPNPPEWCGRQMSLQRLGSGGGPGGPGRKRARLTKEAVQGITNEVAALHELSQGLVGRVDSMEQTLSTLMGLDPDAAFPESIEDVGTASSAGAAASAAASAAVAGEGAGEAAEVPPPSALEGAPLVKQQAVSLSGPVPLPVPGPPPPMEGGTAGID